MKKTAISVLSGAILGITVSASVAAEDAAAVDERIKPVGTVVVAGSAAAAEPAAPAAGGADASAVAQQYGCLACHQLEARVVGPSYKEVAAKYAGDASARDMLIGKVKNGGAGTWGQIPMPPNAHVSDENIALVVDWILSM